MTVRSLIRVAVVAILGLPMACDQDRSPIAPDVNAPVPLAAVVDAGAEVNPNITIGQIQCGERGAVTVALTGVVPPPRDVPLDLMLVLDESGSITSTEWTEIRNAAIALLDRMDAADGMTNHTLSRIRIGVIKFANVANYDLPLTGSYGAIRQFLQTMVQRGGFTNITAALDLAGQRLHMESPPPSAKAVVFMTDGQATAGNAEDAAQLAAATAVKNLPARLFVVGVGSTGEVDENLLTEMASPSSFAFIANFGALSSTFDQIASQVLVFPAAKNLTFTAHVLAPFTLVSGSSSADRGTVSTIGSTVNWAIGTLEAETVTLTFEIVHDEVAAPAGGTLTALNLVRFQGIRPIANTAFAEALQDVLAEVHCNRPPTADAGGPYSGMEGSPVPLALSGSDPDGDELTFEWDLGDGTTGSGSTPPASHVYLEGPSTPTLTLTVHDAHGGTDTKTTSVSISNAAPALGVVTVPLNPVPVGVSVTGTAAFTDPGAADTHAGFVQWDIGSLFEPAAPGVDQGARTLTASRSLAAGVYTITLRVTDDDGGEDTRSAASYVVVYDPSAGFVTGGGWITSPAGAYALDPALAGKATFGFVAKYQKGSTTPSGNTEFQFQAGGLRFQSTSYQWLVVAGARAQFKGDGTLNGSPTPYGFLLTAIDGQVNGGGGVDRFRIKIWDKSTGTVVYDNQMGATEDGDAATTLGGGSIVIHKN